jgi:hypothetical protein
MATSCIKSEANIIEYIFRAIEAKLSKRSADPNLCRLCLVRTPNTYLEEFPTAPAESIMFWCACTAFECEHSNWFLDRNLHVHYLGNAELDTWPCALQTCRRDDKLDYSIGQVNVLRCRLVQNASHTYEKEQLDQHELQWTAACIAVAEVTEEISFFFNPRMDEGLNLLA